MEKFMPRFNSVNKSITVEKVIETNHLFEEVYCMTDDVWTIENVIDVLIPLIKGRIRHCEDELAKATINNECIVREHIILYNGGWFSIPVYTSMVEFVNNCDVTHVDAIPRIIWQQALRHYLHLRNRMSDEDIRLLHSLPTVETPNGEDYRLIERLLTDWVL